MQLYARAEERAIPPTIFPAARRQIRRKESNVVYDDVYIYTSRRRRRRAMAIFFSLSFYERVLVYIGVCVLSTLLAYGRVYLRVRIIRSSGIVDRKDQTRRTYTDVYIERATDPTTRPLSILFIHLQGRLCALTQVRRTRSSRRRGKKE